MTENQSDFNFENLSSIPIGLISKETYTLVNYILIDIVLPIISIVGIVGNVLSLLILYQSSIRYAFCIYLKALTIADVCLLSAALSRFIVSLCSPYYSNGDQFKTYWDLYIGLVAGSIIQQIVSGFITIISIERFIAVVFPLKVKTFSLESKPKRVIICSIIFHVTIHLPTFILFDVKTIKKPLTNETLFIIGEVFNSPNATLVRQYYLIILTVLKYVVPLAIIFCTTFAIVVFLRRRVVREITRIRWCIERDKMTLTLIVMATCFSIVAILTISVYILSAFVPAYRKSEANLLSLLTDISIVIACFNSANDFVIYILASRKFRNMFLKRFFGCKRLRARPSSIQGSSAMTDGSNESSVSSRTAITTVADNFVCVIPRN